MKIEWTIKKGRGRVRPILEYSIIRERWEEDLNPEIVIIKIDQGKSGYNNDLSDDATEPITGPTYSFKIDSRTGKGTVGLRYYGNNYEYPEIKEAFEELSTLHEAAIREAYDQRPINASFLIETSPELKKYVAPGLTADKMSV